MIILYGVSIKVTKLTLSGLRLVVGGWLVLLLLLRTHFPKKTVEPKRSGAAQTRENLAATCFSLYLVQYYSVQVSNKDQLLLLNLTSLIQNALRKCSLMYF